MTTPRRNHHPLFACTLVVCLAVVTYPADTWAKRKANDQNSTQTEKHRKGVSKITYHRSPSEETPAQRDKRLKRECKGMHNAGACLGYTR